MHQTTQQGPTDSGQEAASSKKLLAIEYLFMHLSNQVLNFCFK